MYRIWSKHVRTGTLDCVDSEIETADEARRLLREYKVAFGEGFEIWIEPNPDLMEDEDGYR